MDNFYDRKPMFSIRMQLKCHNHLCPPILLRHQVLWRDLFSLIEQLGFLHLRSGNAHSNYIFNKFTNKHHIKRHDLY